MLKNETTVGLEDFDLVFDVLGYLIGDSRWENVSGITATAPALSPLSTPNLSIANITTFLKKTF